MNTKNFYMMLVAIIAIGIFALPQSVALFSGQHSWYDLSANINDIPCEKCHDDIATEMISDDNGAHGNLSCSMCHRTCFNNYTYASGYGSGSTAGAEAHAAAVVECMDCHGIYHDGSTWNHWAYLEYSDCASTCHWNSGWSDFVSAGGFGLGTTDTDTGEKAAHRKFINDSIDEPLMEGANEACIGCHTRVGVNITWSKNVVLNFSASEDENGDWTIPAFNALGSNVTESTYPNNWTKDFGN